MSGRSDRIGVTGPPSKGHSSPHPASLRPGYVIDRIALAQEAADRSGGMGQPEPVRLGLYYPFIQFRNDSWLKLAALYWDRIGRIVPPGYELQDSDTVLRLQDELGFVTNLAPSEEAMDGVSREFLRLLADRGSELSALYGIRDETPSRDRERQSSRTTVKSARRAPSVPPSRQRESPSPWSNAGGSSYVPPSGQQEWPSQDLSEPRRRAVRGPRWQVPVDPSLVADNDPRLSYIYASGKMTPQLESALVDEGLGVPVRAHGLIGMHPQLAFVYMHALASRVATSVMYPLTDNDFDHAAAGCAAGRIAGALLDSPAGKPPRAGGEEGSALEFAMLALQSVIPKNISSLPVQKIIEIRRRHADELAAFQQATQAIIGSLPEAVASASPDVAAMYLQSVYEKTLEPELRRLKSGLNRSGIDSVFGSMSVKVAAPDLVTSGAAILGVEALHLNPVMTGAGAIVLCLIPRIRRQRAEASQLRANSQAAYLLRLEEELKPTSLASAVTTRARRLMAA